MAGVINFDRTEGQVEYPESSARQCSKQSEIKETKGDETEKIWKRLSLPPNKINNNNNILDVLDKGELHFNFLDCLRLLYNKYACTKCFTVINIKFYIDHCKTYLLWSY